MCISTDYTYESKVLEPFFTHAPFVSYDYHSKNATIAAMEVNDHGLDRYMFTGRSKVL
jgi:uncharacterized membrane protein YkgB